MARMDTNDEVRIASRDMADKAVDAGMRAINSLSRLPQASETASASWRGARNSATASQKVARNFTKAVDKSVAEQPMTTLGMAVSG